MDLGNDVKPLYLTHHYNDPALGDYYLTQVHIRGHLEGYQGMKTLSAHDSSAPHSTYAASVSSAARRALWSVCHTHCQEMHTTEFRHVPRRTSGTEDTVVVLGDDGQDRLNILARVTVALNTDLEGVTTDYVKTHEKLRKAQDRIAELEAQLAR